MHGTKTSFAPRLLGALDLAIDFATLGEYGLEPLPADGPCREWAGHGAGREAFAWPAAGSGRAPRRPCASVLRTPRITLADVA